MRFALVDFGSYVLPYDYHLARGLIDLGHQVLFFGSDTQFNDEFLEALRDEKNCMVISKPVSSSVASRWRGVLSYCYLVLDIWRRRNEYDSVNLQFCARWPMEIPLFFLLRKKFIFTVHNSVPHDFSGRTYWPYHLLAHLAQELWFPSDATAESFYHRYSQRFRLKGKVIQHGTMGIYPDSFPTPYSVPEKIEGLAYWGNIKAYKGIELVLELAKRRADEVGRGEIIEVYGRWSKELRSVHDALLSLGVKVIDRFLTCEELKVLLSRDLVFLLPYRSASQSGVLYTLLHHGCLFFATNVGDFAVFFRRFGLDGLILRDASVESVDCCMDWLQQNLPLVVSRFAEAQQEMSWSRSLLAAGLGQQVCMIDDLRPQ